MEKTANKFGKTIVFDHPHYRFPVLKEKEDIDPIKIQGQLINCNDSPLDNFKYVQFGCGTNLTLPYLNVDISEPPISLKTSSQKMKISVQDNDVHFLRHDMRDGMPEGLSKLEGIYSCHFLEHLTKDDGRNFLEESFKRLAPGGYFRVVVPDFELWIKAYANNNKRFLNWYERNYLKGWDSVTTKCTTLNGLIYNWGHSCMYDLETLTDKLSLIGFTEIIKSRWGASALPSIKMLEKSLNYHQYESLIVECKKPL